MSQYKKHKYRCKCGKEYNEYVWDTDIKKHKFKCIECKAIIGRTKLVIDKLISITSIRTPTKNR